MGPLEAEIPDVVASDMPSTAWKVWEKCERLIVAMAESSPSVRFSPTCSPRKVRIRFIAATVEALGTRRPARATTRVTAARKAAPRHLTTNARVGRASDTTRTLGRSGLAS